MGTGLDEGGVSLKPPIRMEFSPQAGLVEQLCGQVLGVDIPEVAVVEAYLRTELGDAGVQIAACGLAAPAKGIVFSTADRLIAPGWNRHIEPGTYRVDSNFIIGSSHHDLLLTPLKQDGSDDRPFHVTVGYGVTTVNATIDWRGIKGAS